MREGKFALITPVITSTDGRCVATIRWMPTARAFCARRVTESSTSFGAIIIRSANSSMITTMYCSGSGIGASSALFFARRSASGSFNSALYWSMLRTPHSASVR